MESWSVLAVRGTLGIVLGLAVLLWPMAGLGELVALFGIYALLDGITAAAWAVRASRRALDGWPVLLEAVFSVGLGAVALGSPFQSARFVHLVALWAVVTGGLELAAVRLARDAAARCFLVAGGAWSIFLAGLVLSLPHALTDDLVIAIGVYVLVFGILVALGAVALRHVCRPMLRTTLEQTWITR